MAHHVGIGKVENHHVVLAALDALYRLLSYLICAHFGLQVIGGYLGGGDKAAVFVLVGGFHAAVEEEGYVSILLGLCDAQLGLALCRKILAQGVVKMLGLEGNLHLVAEGLVILGHAYVMNGEEAVPALKAVKVLKDEGAGDLAGPVGAEVVEDHAVVCLDSSNGGAVFGNYHRQNELIGNACVVGILHGLYGVCGVYALAVYQRSVCLFNALIAVVPVHGVVAAHYGGDLANAYLGDLLLIVFNVALAALGGHVTAVHEAVDVYLFKALTLCKLQQAKEVILMAVYAAGAGEAVNMQGGIMLFAVFHCAQESGIFKEVALAD